MTCEKCESVVYIPLLLSIQTLHKEVGKDLKLAETIAWPLCTFVLDFRGVQYFQTKEENLKNLRFKRPFRNHMPSINALKAMH